MLRDSDTVEILRVIRERQDPLSWFRGDWPLHNHFYRPISTLAFEFDNWLHPTNAAGFGATNAALVILGVLALYWFVAETTRRPWLAGVSSALFGLWNLPTFGWLAWIPSLFWIPIAGGVIGLFRNGRKGFSTSVAAVLSGSFLLLTFGPVYGLYARMMAWIPGRTASTMMVFCLLGLAAYARYEWQRASRRTVAATPSDVPPTRTAEKPPSNPLRGRWLWAGLSLLFTALALCSYEQAVMLPAIGIAVGVFLWTQGSRPDWRLHAVNWGLLFAYFAVRSRLVPSEVSGYQAQQFRDGVGLWLDIGSYVLPAGPETMTLVTTLSAGLLILFTGAPWLSMTKWAGNWAAYWVAWKDRDRWLIYAFLAMSVLSYLPMALLKHFEHYHAWPGAMRAVYLTALAGAVFRIAITAASPPVLPAPPRSDPAPGSLPHP